MGKSKVSLLMTTYNCRDQFLQSVKSALSQDYRPLELVIKDGGSTDGTKEAIEEEARRLSEHPVEGVEIVFSSCRDDGIYDAMNRAIGMSTGDILAVFNDLFTRPDAVSLMVRAIEESGCQGAHADLIYADGNIVKRYWHMGQGHLQLGWMPAHPTLYLKREVYDTYGVYDTTYETSADYEYMLRILKDGRVKLAYVPQVVIRMFWGGTSNGGGAGYGRNIKEAYRALRENRVAFPAAAIGFRIVRTLGQYRAAAKYAGASVFMKGQDSAR